MAPIPYGARRMAAAYTGKLRLPMAPVVHGTHSLWYPSHGTYHPRHPSCNFPATARMNSGVVPQQPPMKDAPASTNCGT